MPSKLEAELMKATKVRQAENEPRAKYFLRILQAGQKPGVDAAWAKLSTEAQAWYNESVHLYQANLNINDIKEFPDLTSVATRATLTLVPDPEPEEEVVQTKPPEPVEEEPEEEPVSNGEDEEEEVEEEPVVEDEEFEEDQPVVEEPDEPVPLQAAKKPAPPPKKPPPAVKTPGKGKPASVKTKPPMPQIEVPSISRPPKPAAPGASTMIKRLLLKDVNITNAELMEKLRERRIDVTAISVSTIRSDFRHSLRVLQEAGYCQEIGAP